MFQKFNILSQLTPNIRKVGIFAQLLIWSLIGEAIKVSFRVNFVNSFCLFSQDINIDNFFFL